MTVKVADKVMYELNANIAKLEVLSLAIAKQSELIGDSKLNHTVKIIVGTIQAARVYALANRIDLLEKIKKGAIAHGKKSSTKKAATKGKSTRHA